MKRTVESDQYMCKLGKDDCPMNVNDGYCVAMECQNMVINYIDYAEALKKAQPKGIELLHKKSGYKPNASDSLFKK
jgi:hypothetical protein